RRADGRRLGRLDAALLRPRVEVHGAAPGEGAGRADAVDLVEFGDQLEFDGGDAGDLGGQFGGHRGRYGHGRGGAHSGSDRRGGVGGTRDEFVGELLGPEPGELGAQRLEVAYGHAGGHLDDAVREV